MSKRTIYTLLALLPLLLSSCFSQAEKTTPSYDKGINIIPMPAELTEGEGTFELSKGTKLIASSPEEQTIAKFFADKIARSTGYQLAIVPSSTEGAKEIRLKINPQEGANPEGYRLVSTPEGVDVEGQTAQALFFGMQTLMQLLPAEIESPTTVDTVYWLIPAVTIQDEPAFGYRGMHIDVSRHFLTTDMIKRQIDVLSLFKINRLHWHLTDDQGWRIEIKKYPRLTEVGSKRIEADGTLYEGYYTQEQVKEIVAYAAERFIEVIPEIEMPGHAMGAITAYPDLACFKKDYKVRTLWGIEKDVFCAGKEEVFAFISDVIDEVAPLFPSAYFHIGGDECPKERWKKCPHCQARMKAEGLKSEEELQSYFIHRAEEMLQKHGKKLIGWDEILEGGLVPSGTVMSWRGEEGGIEASNMGHDVIMTPGSGGLYIDHYQGDPAIEPLAICCYSPLEKVYSYHPVPEAIAPDKRHHILGAQVNLWGEYLYTPDLFEYRAYPRLLALAELTWTPREKKDFADFSRRVENAYVRLDNLGVIYHIPMPEQPHGSTNFVAFVDSTELVLQSTRPIKMYYRIGGEDREYTAPVAIDKNTEVVVYSILPSGKRSPERTITFEKQSYLPALDLTEEKLRAGLKTQTVVGDYDSWKEIPEEGLRWQAGHVTQMKEVMPDKVDNHMGEVKRKAVVAKGYLRIPADGVYHFYTNYDLFKLGDKLVIDNAGEPKKFSRQGTTIALTAGLHPIEVTFVGAVHGGFPSYWDDGELWIRNLKEEKAKAVTPDMLFCDR